MVIFFEFYYSHFNYKIGFIAKVKRSDDNIKNTNDELRVELRAVIAAANSFVLYNTKL